MIFNMIIVKKG